MAPKIPLTGRYARYKAGTKKVMSWLVTTANHCCDITNIITSLRTTKDQNKATATARATVDLKTAELVKLAEAIAGADPRVPIPADILLTCRDVIEGRQRSADHHVAYASYKGIALTEEDKNHQHFIDALQRIFQVLESARAPDDPAEEHFCPQKVAKRGKKTRKTTSTTKAPLQANPFETLTVEEPTLIEDCTGSAEPPTKVSLDLGKAEFRLEKEVEDRAFALLCHLQDLDDVRLYVRDSWIQYSMGDISFALASMTTEVAFGLLRCADEEFAAMCPELDDYDKILQFLHLEIVAFDNVPVAYVVNTEAREVGRDAASYLNIAGLLFPLGATILTIHGDNATRFVRNEAAAKKGRPQELELACAKIWAGADGFIDVIVRSTLRLLMAQNAQQDRMDDFVRGLKEMPQSGIRRLWLAVACEIYVDIFAILGDHALIGTQSLKDTIQSQLDICDLILRRHSDDIQRRVGVMDERAVQWTDCIKHQAPRALRELDLITKDMDRHVHGAAFEADLQRWTRGRSLYLNGLESRFPVQAGGCAFLLKLQLADAETYIVNHGLFIHSMAYLYKAARHFGLLHHEWHDVDFVIRSQAPSGGTHGPLVPKFRAGCKVSAYAMEFAKACGMESTAEMYRKHGKPSFNLWEEGKQIFLCGEFLEAFIRSIDPKEKNQPFGRGNHSKMIEVMLHKLTSEHAARQGQRTSAQPSSQREMFNPLELLTTFEKSFKQDEPLLNFPYVRFWSTCAELLRACWDAIRDEMPTQFQSLSIHNGYLHAVMVWFMLAQLGKFDDNPRTSYIKSTADSMLAKAAKAIEPYIISHGKDFSEAAYDRSSGRIPKHLRPGCSTNYLEKLATKRDQATTLERAGTSVAFSGTLTSLYHPHLTALDITAAVKASPEDIGEYAVPLPEYMKHGGNSVSLGDFIAPAKVWIPEYDDEAELRRRLKEVEEYVRQCEDNGEEEKISQEMWTRLEDMQKVVAKVERGGTVGAETFDARTKEYVDTYCPMM